MLRRIVKLLRPRDVRDHYDAVLAELLYFERNERSLWDQRLLAADTVLQRTALAVLCEVVGHDYEPDGCDYPESGGEGFTCRRCGTGFTAWH